MSASRRSPFDAAGLHGIEHRIGGPLSPCRPKDHPALRAAVERLNEILPPVTASSSRTRAARSRCTGASRRITPILARATVQATEAALGRDYRIQFGKAVAEILPAASGKGQVIERFLHRAAYRGRRPVFIGDDLTDEHGFEAVNALRRLVDSGRDRPDGMAHSRLATPAA